MKIADVRAHVLEAQLSQPFSYARAWYASRTALIVEIVTDEGLVGWGECYGPARINASVVEAMRPVLVGQCDAQRMAVARDLRPVPRPRPEWLARFRVTN
jgi:D-galactarolactone cycloisomerase